MITLEKIFEPRLVINSDQRFIALMGSNSMQYRSTPGIVGAGSIEWNTIDPPNPDSILGRKVYISVDVSMTFNAAAGENTLPILRPGTDGLRAFPFTSCISSLVAKVNGQAITSDMLNDTIHARSRYFNFTTKSLNLSETGALLDKTQEYADLFGGTNNPLGILGDSGLFSGETRGILTNLNITANSPTTASITFTVTEPLFLFPFEFATNANETGISRLQTIQVSLVYINANRMWCHDFANGSVIDTMSTTIRSAYIHMNLLTPPNDYPLPISCTLPFDDFRPFARNLGVFQPGEERSTDTISFTVQTVPQQLFLYAKESRTSINSSLHSQIGTTDTFALISHITLFYDNAPA